MYIKAWRNKKNLTGSTRPRCGRGREGPCFAVCAVVCDPVGEGKCVPAAVPRNERCGVCAGGVEDRVDNVLETLV